MANERERIGLGVVGLGMAAAPHARALKDLGARIDLRGVFARDPGRRAAFAETYGFTAAPSLQALVEDDGLDAVLILTPPNARADLVAAFAGAGKHILMEKPVERTTAAAEAIVRTCAENGVALGIVFQHRFRAGSLKLKALLADGALGAIAAVRLDVPWWRPQAYYDEPGRGTLERDGGGVLISQAIHSLDLMLSLTGPVREVQAVAATTRLHAMETEDFVGAGLRFDNGAVGAATATTAAYPGGAEALHLECERASATLKSGTLIVNWHDRDPETFGEASATGGGADPMDFPHDWHRALIEDFLDAVAQGRPPAIPGRDALVVHRLIDALLRSSAEGRAVRLGEET